MTQFPPYLFSGLRLVWLLMVPAVIVTAEETNSGVEHLKFEGSLIEGQLGAIKALIVTSEKRPEFGPMALQLGNKEVELRNISQKIVEENKYRNAFKVKLPD